MENGFREALKKRHSYYDISGKSGVSDDKLAEMLEFAVLHTPSSFNCQSARLALMLGAQHAKVWEMIREALRKILPVKDFTSTDDKINSFAAGYGTVLFFEDMAVIEGLQQNYPLYKDNFPLWSHHSTGMHQLVVWTLLRDAGLGASLQHYGNLIEDEARKAWGFGAKWRLIAQMPFGTPLSEPEAKEKLPVRETVKVFK